MPLPPGFQLEQGSNLPERFILDRRKTNAPIPQFEQDALNPAGQMSGAERFLAGIGKTFTDIGQGASQMVGLGPSRQEVDERRDRDVSLMATPEGFSGTIAGGVAATLPAVFAGPSMAAAIGTGALFGALQPVGEGESRTLNTVAGAGTAGLTKYGVDKVASGLSRVVAGRNAQAAPANARAAELARVLREGQDQGFVVPPSQANPSLTNRAVEMVGGKAATKQAAALKNQDVSYAIAQKTAGLAPDQALTEANLAAARNTAAEPYRAIAQKSPEAASLLERWKEANSDAKGSWFEFNRQGTVASRKAAEAAEKTADEALDQIEQIAGPAAKQALQAARVQIAKIHTVDRAMNGSSFDPAALVRQANSGAKITGDLAKVIQFAKDFPKAMERPQLQGSPGVNQLLPFLGAGGGAAVGGPAGAMLGTAASQAVPPLARALMLSPQYQRTMTQIPMQGPSNSLMFAKALANNPQLQRMLPAGGALLGSNLE